MGFNLRSLLRGRSAPRQFTSVDELVAALRRLPAGSSVTPDAADTVRGQIAGAESRGRATLPSDPASGPPKFRGGFLAGHLNACLIRALGTMSVEHLLPTSGYAASLLSPEAGRHLVEAPPRNLLRTHTYACLRVAELMEMPAELEHAAFRWLADQLSIPVTPELEGRYLAMRQQRLGLVVEREMDRTRDHEAATAHRAERRIAVLAAGVQRQLAAIDPASTDADRLRGALAGLETVATSGLLVAGVSSQEPSETRASEAYRGGLLGGHLQVALARTGRMVDDALRLHAYRYGAALASSQGIALLAEPRPTNALKAHQFAMHTVNQRAAGPIAEGIEIAMLEWLAAQLDVPVTPEFLSDRHHFVARPVQRR
jgi:hypothetical protein